MVLRSGLYVMTRIFRFHAKNHVYEASSKQSNTIRFDSILNCNFKSCLELTIKFNQIYTYIYRCVVDGKGGRNKPTNISRTENFPIGYSQMLIKENMKLGIQEKSLLTHCRGRHCSFVCTMDVYILFLFNKFSPSP